MLLGENGAVVTVGLLVEVLSPEISRPLLGSPASVKVPVLASILVPVLASVPVPASLAVLVLASVSVAVSISVAASKSVAVSEATLESRFEAGSMFLRTSVSTTASRKVGHFRLDVEARGVGIDLMRLAPSFLGTACVWRIARGVGLEMSFHLSISAGANVAMSA